MELVLSYLVTGACAGLLAGLFGVGGGLIIVPALALLLPPQGVDPAIVMQLAIGTSLSVIAFTSMSSTLAHHRRGAVLWPVFRALVPGLIVGALLGAGLAHVLSGDLLRRVVGIGALLVAAKMAFDLKPGGSRNLPGSAGLGVSGGVIGSLSSLIGIGGGSLTVPFLSLCRVPMQQAVGTSAACGLPIAWAGALGFVISGWSLPNLPPWSLGYVALPGLLGIAVASVSCAPLGARLAHRLPAQRLKQAFALLLAVIGVRMLMS